MPIAMHAHVASGARRRSRHHHHRVAIPAPRNAWTATRAPHAARAGIFADSDRAAVDLPVEGSPTLGPSPVPAPSSASQPTAVAHASALPTVPMPVIMGGAVGGAVVVAVILAFIYILRIKRRVKRMKRCTDVLGPGASPQDQGSRLCSDRLNRLVRSLALLRRVGAYVTVPVVAVIVRLVCEARWDAYRPAIDVRSDSTLPSSERSHSDLHNEYLRQRASVPHTHVDNHSWPTSCPQA